MRQGARQLLALSRARAAGGATAYSMAAGAGARGSRKSAWRQLTVRWKVKTKRVIHMSRANPNHRKQTSW